MKSYNWPWVFVKGAHKPTQRQLADSLKKLIAIVEMYAQEAGGCDHSVGICMCGENRDLAEAKELLERL